MKKVIAVFILLLTLNIFVSEVFAVTRVYLRSVLTGGITGALDALDGDLPSPTKHSDPLNDGDKAIVITLQNDADNPQITAHYVMDADSGLPETPESPGVVPTVIAPDTNPGDKRWLLTILKPGGLDAGTDAQMLISDGANLNPRTLSGGATIDNTGVVQIDLEGAIGGEITGDTAVVGDMTVGTTPSDDVQPTFSIIGDADSDAGGDTDDTFSLTLLPNATPTSAYWDFDSTQAFAFRFNKRVDILSTTADNKIALNIDLTANSGTALGLRIIGDYQHGDQGNGYDINVSSTGAAAVTDDLKAAKATAKYERSVSFGGNRMVDGVFGQALWNVNSASLLTGSYINGFHVTSGLGFDSGDTTNMDIVDNLTGVLIEKTNFYASATALPIVQFTNYRGIWIKDTAVEVWSGDDDAIDIINVIGMDIEDQTRGTNNYGIVLDNGENCAWLHGLVGVGLCSKTTVISAAEMAALETTPIVIATGRPDTFLEPVSFVLVYDFLVAFTEASSPDNMVIEYEGGDDITAAITAAGFITAGTDEMRYAVPTATFTTDLDLDPYINKDIQLLNAGDGTYAAGTGAAKAASNCAATDGRITSAAHGFANGTPVTLNATECNVPQDVVKWICEASGGQFSLDNVQGCGINSDCTAGSDNCIDKVKITDNGFPAGNYTPQSTLTVKTVYRIHGLGL